MKRMKALLVMAVGWMSWAAYAQYNGQYSPAIMNEISKAGAAASERNNAAAQAEANRQWWAEENRIRAKIEKLKQTPFYGAIAIHKGSGYVSSGGGYATKDIAIKRNLEACTTSSCEIVAIFANTCAMLARPDKDPGNPNASFIAFDGDGGKAILKSVLACEAKYGQGNCNYIGNGKEAICSGYQYGIYNQK